MNYLEALDFIQSFPDMERGTGGAKAPTMTLVSMRSLLSRLGDPQNGRRTIHVTGSKGKGSTCIMIASILQEAEFSTALFTSPHLHSYRERLCFDLMPVSREEFAAGVAAIRPQVEAEHRDGSGPLATFGILVALFFHLCKTREPKVDWQIVEVGLGGRDDATNVFDEKDLAVITPVSLEHTAILGGTPADIAANKAGIITSGSTTVLARQKDAGARAAVSRRCREVNSRLVDLDSSYQSKLVSHDGKTQTFEILRDGSQIAATIPMLGAHQIDNATTATAAADALSALGVPIKNEHIVGGLSNATLSGRFEIFRQSDNQPLMVLDGAHNHESAQALARALSEMLNARQCLFVLGVNADKNISSIWHELSAISKGVIATKSINARSMDPQAVADAIKGASGIKVSVTGSVPEALDKARAIAGKDDVICVTGSLYVVAEARAQLMGKRSN